MPETKEEYMAEITAVTNKLIRKLYPVTKDVDVMAWAEKYAPVMVQVEELARSRIDWDEPGDKASDNFQQAVRTWARALLKIYKQYSEEKK